MKINYTLKHSAVGYVSLNIQRNKITKINGNGLNVLTCTNFGQNNTKIKPVYCGIKENTKINSPCQETTSQSAHFQVACNATNVNNLLI